MKPSLIGSAILALPFISSVLAFSETTERAVSAFAKRDTISDILTDIEDAATCDACESLLVVLKLLAATGNDAFVDVITDICVDLVSFQLAGSWCWADASERRVLRMRTSGKEGGRHQYTTN